MNHHATRSGLVSGFVGAAGRKPGTQADPRRPARSLTSERWDKVSSKSLGDVPAPKVKTHAEVMARIAPKVRRHATAG